LSAWVPSKLDNIQRGIFRDNQALNHENTVRAIASRLDLITQSAHLPSRIDIDNAGMPSAGAYDPWGIYVFTALEASREIVVIDSWSRQEVLRFPAGRAPQGVTLSPNGLTLYVHNFMDRSITVHNISSIIQGGNTAPVINITLNAVTTESLSAEVLQGKKLFYDAKDPRLALQEYMSCATCHNDGGHDGRTWDLTGFGEGLRNTITLKGHGNHGTLHWTGNFDEVQDFEGQIRNLAGGTGLISAGTPNPPLGTANAGRSADLDALAAYVKSLTAEANSPMRTSTGALSTAAVAGQQVFRAQNCASCHGGVNFSNSALNVFANVGTILPSSGQRLGAALTGFDVPTLRGAWATGPYLHDGRAATLAASIAAHQGVTLSTTDLTNLVAFVQSIDSQPMTAPMPFTVALSTPAATVSAPFTVTAVFNGPTTNFILSDVLVTNAAVSAFTGTGTTYSFTVTPLAAGIVTVRVPPSAATDSTSLGNLVSNTLSVSFLNVDITPPAVTLSTSTTAVSAPFTINVTFSEVVTGLLFSEFAVTNGSVTALSSAGTLWVATVTPSAAGLVTVNLPANLAQDAAGNGNTISNTLTVTHTPPQVVTGITGTYYVGKNFETLRFSRIDNNIDFTWPGAPDPQLPADGFSVRWQGCIVAPTTGSYDITTRSDDGVRLWLNGVQVISNWTNHGETWDSTTLTLQANVPVTMTMEFYEDSSSAVARLWWSGPGVAFSAIPQSALRINENGMTVPPYPVTYAAWLASARAPSTANADGDDVPDLMEYALGSSATTAIQLANSGLQLIARPNNAVDAILLRPSAVTDVSYELEVSADLLQWSPLLLAPALVNDSPGIQRINWSNIHLYGPLVRLRVRHSGGNTAVSTPVGWQSLSLNAGIQSYGLNLLQRDIFTGIIASNTTSRAQLNDKSSLTGMVDMTQRYYAEIKNGTYAGHRFDIQFFSDDAFTILPSSMNNTLAALPPGLAGSQVAIRAHATIGSVFDKMRFTASARQGNADQVLFYAPSGYITYWLRQSVTASQWTLVGDSSLANADTTLLPSGTGVLLSLVAPPSQPFLQIGKVRVTPFARPLSLGYQLVANPWPLTLTPNTAGLTSSAFQGSTLPSTADAMQTWGGDQTPSLNSYTGYWLLQSSTQLPTWMANSITQSQSQNDMPILQSGRATFIQIRETNQPRPLWILSPP
ncbi:MAG: PA14 domain-containing protein, partial [Verrucomicrobia bacterium]|nr:PA14 domain-containing protein [Verrucomicrobiota bacterium]